MKKLICALVLLNSVLANASFKGNKTKEGYIDFAVSCEKSGPGCEKIGDELVHINSKVELKVLDATIKESENIFVHDRKSNEKVIEVQLGEEARKTLGSFTKNNIGKMGYMLFNNEIVFKAVIGGSITSSKLQIALGKNKQQTIHETCRKLYSGCDVDKAEAQGDSKL